jgi:uncharacterized membrane protein YecN with MAPEG domain
VPITAFYAALIAVLFLVLSARTIGARRAAKVEIGTARRGEDEDRELLRRVRVHANCAEYAPIAILLIGLAESLKAPGLLLHGLGAALIIGRVIHAYGLSQTPHVMPLRVGGMVLTLNVIAIAAIVCLVYAAPGIF